MGNSRSKQPESLPDRVAGRLVALQSACAKPLQLCVAFSGGLDSTVLLHVLAGLASGMPLNLRAFHVNHGLSGHADAWSMHCRQVCEELRIPLRIERVEVSRSDEAGLEGAARRARYEALSSHGADWLVLAHHADDQAETLLFRLCRGAGVTGAACMREIDSSRWLFRPLLSEARTCLEAYAHENGLVWIEDDSNPDLRFSRNYIRHEVLAPLRARFSSVIDNLVRSASLFDESDQLLIELAIEDSQRVCPGQIGSRDRFRALPIARARNLIRTWLRDSNPMLPDMARLDDGLRQLSTDKSIRWVFGQSAVCAYRDVVWMEPARLEVPDSCRWLGESAFPWAAGTLRLPSVAEYQDALVHISAPKEGMYWRLSPERPKRAFRLLCQDAGVPPWWRKLLPCLWRGDELLWIGGLGAVTTSIGAPAPEWVGGWQYFQQDMGCWCQESASGVQRNES